MGNSHSWIRKMYYILSLSMLLFICGAIVSISTIQTRFEKCWIVFPIIIYLVLYCIKHFSRRTNLSRIPLEIVAILASICLFLFQKVEVMQQFIIQHIEVLAFFIILNFLLSITYLKKISEIDTIPSEGTKDNNPLFNIFYLNTSKAHEIAMLIDNRIMKTVEKEQTSEAIIKHQNAIRLGKSDYLASNVEYASEDSTKKRVYESFDVKNTKSIMLKKIYETVAGKRISQDPGVGQLILFKDIKLKQLNVDDTVMILKILQESKLRNQANDSIEINFNKMMEKMLDDFTIDYSFTYSMGNGDKSPCLIQLPYRSISNFENGYQHNDLQLGQLSLIGIYRGKIDFKQQESISSRFLELISDSINQEMQIETPGIGMRLSEKNTIVNQVPFEFKHKKLTEEYHLIDVIAIIQEIRFKETNNE